MNCSRWELCLMEWAVEQKSQLATAMLQVTFNKVLFSFKHLVVGSMCWIDWVMSTVPLSKYDVDNEETSEDTLGLRQADNDFQVTICVWCGKRKNKFLCQKCLKKGGGSQRQV